MRKDLSIKLILLVFVLGIFQVKSTNAFFTDTETSLGNTMTAGYWEPIITPLLLYKPIETDILPFSVNLESKNNQVSIVPEEPDLVTTPVETIPVVTPELTLEPSPIVIIEPFIEPVPITTPETIQLPTPTVVFYPEITFEIGTGFVE
jgi:hypothetical protein